MKNAARIFFVLVLFTIKANAFSLFGPFEPWMTSTNSLRLSGDIGGPMNLGEEYRWNVPVVTYAFDQSFLDYFGSNGVAAVEQAIQILNALPPASSIDLTNYPLVPLGYNYSAETLNLIDLKTLTLSLLLEQMGLAEPTRHVFDLRDWTPQFTTSPYERDWYLWAYPSFIVQRNFDPESLEPSHYVNGTLYSGVVVADSLNQRFEAWEFPVDPLAETYTAVSDLYIRRQIFINGLSRDDVGGLRYLLRSNNINFEILLDNVHGVGTNATNFVNAALRPGVEKITFVRQDIDSLLGFAFPITTQYVDSYITNNTVVQQQVERVVTTPDFVFSSGATGTGAFLTRSGTSNWWKDASSDQLGLAGPGVIRPSVKITFNRLPVRIQSYDDDYGGDIWSAKYEVWGSFDASTNSPVVYLPHPPQENTLTVRLKVFPGSTYGHTPFLNKDWTLPIPLGGTVNLESSTNMVDWSPVATLLNQTGEITWDHAQTRSQRFFRVRPN